MDSFLTDLRHAWKSLRRSPGFALVAILTLALGIGANVAIFSAVNAALIRPLPYPDPDRLVQVIPETRKLQGTASPPDFADWRAQSHSFTEMTAVNEGSWALSGEGPAEQLSGAAVTPGFFRVMGVSPAQGRGFTAEEAAPGRNDAVVISEALWRTRFGGQPDLVGRTIRLDGVSRTVTGIMPAGFDFPGGSDLWLPLGFSPEDLATQRGAHYLDVFARLAPEMTLAGATGDLATVVDRIREQYPRANPDQTVRLARMQDALVGTARGSLLLLLAAVGVVLLIASVNVANLFLARGTGRSRELAVRAALGASTGRLASLVLAECLWLGLAGTLVGLFFAAWGTSLIVALAPPIAGLKAVAIDRMVLGFALAEGLLATLLFGLLPALRSARQLDLQRRLREGGAAVGGRAGRRSRSLLVTTEVALAVVLVIGAGLLLKSFARLRSVDIGFDPRGVLTFQVSLPDQYTPERTARFYGGLIDRIEALPGIQSSGAVFGLPLSNFGYQISVKQLDGRELGSEEQERSISPQVRVITADYLRTMGVALRRGRGFTQADRNGTAPVILVNEAAARRLWGGADPLGHHLVLGTRLGLGRGLIGGEVVGVVGDVRDRSPGRPASPQVFLVHDQFPTGYMSVVIKSGVAPAVLAKEVQAEIAALDPEVPMFRVRPMEEWLSRSVGAPRFYALLLGLFAALALILALIGVYGVLSQAVGERTREIGLRIALGAHPGQVRTLVMRQGLGPAAFGLLLGLLLALAVTPILRSQLYDVSPVDSVTYLLVVSLLVLTALAAAWFPARRAARVDPLIALQAE
jgi:putative ABC transport system permease protein